MDRALGHLDDETRLVVRADGEALETPLHNACQHPLLQLALPRAMRDHLHRLQHLLVVGKLERPHDEGLKPPHVVHEERLSLVDGLLDADGPHDRLGGGRHPRRRIGGNGGHSVFLVRTVAVVPITPGTAGVRV